MCLFSTKEVHEVDRHGRPLHGVLDAPPHSSRYSAYPVPGVARVPRGIVRDSYEVRRSRESIGSDRVIEYRRERERSRSRQRPRPREIEYVEPRGSRRSVDFVRDERRSVSRVRY